MAGCTALNLNTNPSHFLCTLEQKRQQHLPFPPLVLQPSPKSGGKEISLSFYPGVVDSQDHMKTFWLVLLLSVLQLLFFSKCSSSSNIFMLEQGFSLRVCLLSVDQTNFGKKKLKTYNLQVSAIIFDFACFLIGHVVSEITSLFHVDYLKILNCSRIKLLL